MSNSFEMLEWDSNFFGINVARLSETFCPNDLTKIVKELKRNQVEVFYGFVNPCDYNRNQALLQKGAVLVDEKVSYCIDARNCTQKPIANVFPYSNRELDPALTKIAQQAGEFSRFRIDKKFGVNACNRLYEQWIENAVNGKFDNHVFVFEQDNEILGLITLKDLSDSGSIGLIGVDERARGKQVGASLLNKAISHYGDEGVFSIKVVTQKANHLACRFYEKNGFEVCNVTNVYHVWI